MTLHVSGALPALATPLLGTDELDVSSFSALIEQALLDGAAGVLVAGSTGEGPLLEAAQRSRLVRAAVAAATGATVIACASGPTVEDVVRDVGGLAEAGADLALVLAPSYYPLEPEELADAHLRVAERASIPTLAYHIPQFTGSALTAETVAVLAGHSAIVGMKDSSPDADRRASFVTAAGPEFSVMTGHAPTLRHALESGVAGSITAIANLRQRTVVALHAAVLAGDAATAARLQEALARCVAELQAVPGSMPAVVKAGLQLNGIIAERWCRPPLHSVPSGALDRVRTALMA